MMIRTGTEPKTFYISQAMNLEFSSRGKRRASLETDPAASLSKKSRNSAIDSSETIEISGIDPLLEVYNFFVVKVDIMKVQVKQNLIRDTKIEKARQIWTEEFSLTPYGSGGRFITVAPLGNYNFESFQSLNDPKVITDDLDVILVDGAHRATVLKEELMYKSNKHISAFLYARKDERVMNDEDFLIIGSMQNAMDQKGCRMSMVDNVSMCKRFLKTILATQSIQESQSMKDLRSVVTGAKLRKVMQEKNFNVMKPRQLLKYTTIVAAIHKFPILEMFIIDSIANCSYQLRVFGKALIWEGSNHHEEALFTFKRVGQFAKENPNASERDLTKYTSIVQSFVRILSRTIARNEPNLSKGYSLTVNASVIGSSMLSIGEYAEEKLKRIDHEKILTEARQWTTCISKILSVIRSDTNWSLQPEISNSEFESRMVENSREKPLDKITLNTAKRSERTSEAFQKPRTREVREEDTRASLSIPAQFCDHNLSSIEPVTFRKVTDEPKISNINSKSRESSRESISITIEGHQNLAHDDEVSDLPHSCRGNRKQPDRSTPWIPVRKAKNSIRMNERPARQIAVIPSSSASIVSSAVESSNSSPYDDYQSSDESVAQENSEPEPTDRADENVYASADNRAKTSLIAVEELSDKSGFRVTHRWNYGFTYNSPRIRKEGWFRIEPGSNGDHFGWHRILRHKFSIFDDRLSVDVSFNPSWKMEPMSSRFIDTDKMVKHLPNCSGLFTDPVENGLILEAALRAVGIRPPHRAHFILRPSDITDIRARLAVHLLKASHQGIRKNAISMRSVLYSGHAEYVIEGWLKSKLKYLNTVGYVVFKGFSNDNELFNGLIQGEDEHANEINDLFDFVTGDAPKDGDTVPIVDPRPVSNKWTTICNKNDRSDSTEDGNKNDVRYSTRAWATNGAFETDKKKLRYLAYRTRMDFRILQLSSFLGLHLRAERGDEEEIIVSKSYSNVVSKRYLYCPDTGGRFLGTGSKCRDQLPHLDFEPDEHGSEWDSMKEPGYFSIVTGKEETAIWIMPNSHEYTFLHKPKSKAMGKLRKLSILNIPPHSIFICRGDVIHAGCGYKAHEGKRKWRYHLYLVRENSPHADAIHLRKEYSLGKL